MPTIKKITSEEKVEKVDQKKKRVRHTYIFAVGRRKTSIARTRLIKSGEGKITINDKDLAQYNASETIKLWDVYPNDRVDYTIGLMTQANDATARVYCLHTKCMDSIPNSYRPSQ